MTPIVRLSGTALALAAMMCIAAVLMYGMLQGTPGKEPQLPENQANRATCNQTKSSRVPDVLDRQDVSDAISTSALMGMASGSLDDANVAKVLRSLDSLYSDRSQKVARAQTQCEASGSLQDYLEFLRQRFFLVKFAAAMNEVRQGKYLRLDPHALLPVMNKGYTWESLTGVAQHDGAWVTVFIPVKLKSYPELAALDDAIGELSRELSRGFVEEFNGKDYDERKTIIEKHYESQRAMAELGKNLMRMNDEDIASRLRELGSDLLRGRFSIDRRAYLLILR